MEYFVYVGKNNKVYVSIGKVLIECGLVECEKMLFKVIKDWVLVNDEVIVCELFEENFFFVFFKFSVVVFVKGSAGIFLLLMVLVVGDCLILFMGMLILVEVFLLNVDGIWFGVY